MTVIFAGLFAYQAATLAVCVLTVAAVGQAVRVAVRTVRR